MKFRNFLIALLIISAGQVFPRIPAAADSGYTSHFGRNNYVEYWEGSLPLILSAPHGGSLMPSEIPDRTWGVLENDTRTRELVLSLFQELFRMTGQYPHVIINNLRRIKLDANRDSLEAAQGNIYAEQAWREYMHFITSASNTVTKNMGKGLYLDIHGHNHPLQQVELGYFLSGADLDKPDSIISSSAYVNKSSVRNLALTNRQAHSLAEVIRGSSSLGSLLESNGISAVPDKVTFSPGSLPYFYGGYCSGKFGSSKGGTIDGILVEHYYKGLRDSDANVKAYSRILARVLLEFMKYYYGFDLITEVNNTPAAADHFSLGQNFPNPFNPSTQITYSIAKESPVSLTIYDALGREVASYVNRVQSPGNYTETVNLETYNCSGGIYFCRLTAGSYLQTVKMILLK